jgi:serine/threonine-protein kinase
LVTDRELSETSEPSISPIFDYTDPLAQERPEYGGRWIAGVARVGNTELVVIVQERYTEAIGPPVALAKSVVLWGWSGLGVAAIIAAAVIWRRGNRSRAQPRQSAA